MTTTDNPHDAEGRQLPELPEQGHTPMERAMLLHIKTIKAALETAEAKGALAAWVRGQQGKGLRDTEILTRFADAYDALITQEVTDD